MAEEHVSVAKPQIKILVIDDKEENLFSVEAILEKDGYIIQKANSGKEALRILLKEFDFSLILMDVQMPDLNGFETADLIYQREKLRHIPIIFITANDRREESVFKGYQMGGVDYLYKPINPDLLRAKVGVFVDLYKKNHQLIEQEQKLIAANKKLEKEIQERKNSEEQVINLNNQLLNNINQLKLTNEELERFAYVASHDLQEPLRKIILFGDRLAEKYGDVLNDEGRDYIGRMTKATGRMQTLIKNILAFSKAGNGGNGVFEETDLNTLIDSVIADLELFIEQKNAVMTIAPLPTLPVLPDQLRQVFQNLVVNALKFGKDDQQPEISIYSEIVRGAQLGIPVDDSKKDMSYCRIYVQDNGIGFEQKYADQIFTIFKRLHSFDKFEGTGIGLSICKKIVDNHHGFITATGEPGKGATFIITLPLVQPLAEIA